MKQKGEFYKVKKSGFSMLLLLICVSMLSVMPVSAARKKSRYDLQFSDLKVNKKKLKAGEKCEISMKVKNKGTGKILSINGNTEESYEEDCDYSGLQ